MRDDSLFSYFCFVFFSLEVIIAVFLSIEEMDSVLNQRCCGSGQYNLPDKILRLDTDTILNQSYVLFITLVNITYQSRDQYLQSIHSWDSNPWQVLYIPFSLIFFSFLPAVVLNWLSCSACILQTRNKPNQFLIQIKVYFFSNLWFCPSFKSLLLLL